MAEKDWKKLADISVALLEKSSKNMAENNKKEFESAHTPKHVCVYMPTHNLVLRLCIKIVNLKRVCHLSRSTILAKTIN